MGRASPAAPPLLHAPPRDTTQHPSHGAHAPRHAPPITRHPRGTTRHAIPPSPPPSPPHTQAASLLPLLLSLPRGLRSSHAAVNRCGAANPHRLSECTLAKYLVRLRESLFVGELVRLDLAGHGALLDRLGRRSWAVRAAAGQLRAAAASAWADEEEARQRRAAEEAAAEARRAAEEEGPGMLAAFAALAEAEAEAEELEEEEEQGRQRKIAACQSDAARCVALQDAALASERAAEAAEAQAGAARRWEAAAAAAGDAAALAPEGSAPEGSASGEDASCWSGLEDAYGAACGPPAEVVEAAKLAEAARLAAEGAAAFARYADSLACGAAARCAVGGPRDAQSALQSEQRQPGGEAPSGGGARAGEGEVQERRGVEAEVMEVEAEVEEVEKEEEGPREGPCAGGAAPPLGAKGAQGADGGVGSAPGPRRWAAVDAAWKPSRRGPRNHLAPLLAPLLVQLRANGGAGQSGERAGRRSRAEEGEEEEAAPEGAAEEREGREGRAVGDERRRGGGGGPARNTRRTGVSGDAQSANPAEGRAAVATRWYWLYHRSAAWAEAEVQRVGAIARVAKEEGWGQLACSGWKAMEEAATAHRRLFTRWRDAYAREAGIRLGVGGAGQPSPADAMDPEDALARLADPAGEEGAEGAEGEAGGDGEPGGGGGERDGLAFD